MPETRNPNAPLHGDYRDFSLGGRYGPTGAEPPQRMGSPRGRPEFDYWAVDPADVNAYLQTVQNDPEIRQAAQRGSWELDGLLRARGYRVPEHYKADVDQNGQIIVKEQSWWDKHKSWALPAIGMGAAIGTGPLIGAFGGGGGGAGGNWTTGKSTQRT